MTNDLTFFVQIDDNWPVAIVQFSTVQVRDQNIVAMCKEMGIAVTHEHSHTLYNLEK